jgi:hypothetical protein
MWYVDRDPKTGRYFPHFIHSGAVAQGYWTRDDAAVVADRMNEREAS